MPRRTTDIEIHDDGHVTFMCTSEIYGVTTASGELSHICDESNPRRGWICLQDGCDYKFSKIEMDALNSVDYTINRITNVHINQTNAEYEISCMIVRGNRLEFPDFKLESLAKVKKLLKDHGGRYRKSGFDFDFDPTNIQDVLSSGGNPKKFYQIYQSTTDIGKSFQKMLDIKPEHDVLEPSAGEGNLVDGLNPDQVDCVEIYEPNRAILEKKGYNVVGTDFMDFVPLKLYDRIIANPPFSRGQDCQHVVRMYDMLQYGGRMAAFTSRGWADRSDRISTSFREWLKDKDYVVLSQFTSKDFDNGAGVDPLLILINK